MGFYITFLIFFLLAVLTPDLFIFSKLKKYKVNIAFYIINFLPSAYFLFLISYLSITHSNGNIFDNMRGILWLNFIFILIHIPKLVYIFFHLLNSFVNLFLKDKISIIKYVGMMIAMFVVVVLLHGTFINPLNIETKEVELEFENLPASFDGYKIVQFSDTHLGSWGKQTKYLETAVYAINRQEADILVFTGDMVNNYYTEMIDWKDLFLRMEAKDGKFAVMGNHDYGEYAKWKNEADKQKNIRLIKENIEKFDFQLLCNESVKLYKDSSFIELVGVENWGKEPFPHYGDLELAMKNTDSTSLKILLSHDPSHWKSEILEYKDIALCLSGHTHAAQMSFNIYGKRRSPSTFLYKEWDGLYQVDNQYLYVNRGLGYIGVPTRLGAARPEITVIKLRKKQINNEIPS